MYKTPLVKSVVSFGTSEKDDNKIDVNYTLGSAFGEMLESHPPRRNDMTMRGAIFIFPNGLRGMRSTSLISSVFPFDIPPP